MALKITQTDPLAIGERWIDYEDGIAFKLAGLDSPEYKIALQRARRLIAREDARQALSNVRSTAADEDEDKIQCDLLGRYIIRDWRGDIQDESGSQIGYTPEAAARLLRGNVALFAWVIARASEIAEDAHEEASEIVGKRSPASAGKESGEKRAKSGG